MRKVFRFIAFVIALSCLFSTSAFALDMSELEGVNWDDLPTEREYNLTYNERNYEGPFELGVVMITLKQGVPHDTNFKDLFPELNITDISILISPKDEDDRFVLVVTLSEKTRKSVIEAIELLKSNPVVYLANISGYIYVDFPIKGDIDHSRKVENNDLVLLARYIVGLEEFSGMQFYNADIDNDNEVTNTDLISIAKMIVSEE